ncbi:MAG: hypothetical protein ABSH51_03375 [Solirubrobacteraceae bacterium]|jgi:hypothetical protein
MTAPAVALAPGVFVDPNSPAGQAYAYPLSVLRAQGAGRPAPTGTTPAPSFGVGITPAGSPRPGDGTRRAPGSVRRGGRRTSIGSGPSATGARGVAAGADPALARLASSSSPVGPTALIVFGVLASAVAVGLAVRLARRLGPLR